MLIDIYPHYKRLFPTDQITYRDQVERLLSEAFEKEPWFDWMIRPSFRHPCLGVPDDQSDRVKAALHKLCDLPVEQVVYETLKEVTALIGPETDTLECHLYPGIDEDKGGGASFAPGKILIGVPISPDWKQRVQRNCAHEYSHTVRMAIWPQDERHGFGEARAYTIRDYLIFEGLAESIADELFPGIDETELTDSQERSYWEYVQPLIEKTGISAYIKGMFPDKSTGLPSMVGYRVATRLVGTYIKTRRARSAEIQRLPYEELYWNSNYPFIC